MNPYKINFNYTQIWICQSFKATIFIRNGYSYNHSLIELFPFRLRQISIFYDAIDNIKQTFFKK